MILELVNLQVKAGSVDEFHEAFEVAKPLITKQAGFRSIELQRSVEDPSSYVLLVFWDSVEAHMEGFVKSPELVRWRELLDHHYETPPTMAHFELISRG